MRDFIFRAVGAFGGTLGCTFLINAPRNTAIPASITAMIGYILYLVMDALGYGRIPSYFFATVIISVICEILARVMHMPATIFLLSALLPLVPGYNFYCAMLALVENNGPLAATETFNSLQAVAAIAMGAAATSVFFRAISKKHPPVPTSTPKDQ